jgi:phosphoglycerate dehydrogenase-like enzyme
VVDVGDGPDGLIWLSSSDVDGLGGVLSEQAGIRWVQLPFAGIERFADAGLLGDGRQWTCAKGSFAPEVAEHALALALAGLRRLPERARARSWGQAAGTSLFGREVLILGAGGIATELIRLLQPFGTTITVMRRSRRPFPGAARTITRDELADVLPGATVVWLALALTSETRRIIAGPELDAMSPPAWLVNVARGGHVDTGALVAALEARAIGGAALDVTDPEPLPAGHPLWDLPNCLITPHSADWPEVTEGPLAERIADNVARFADGRPLLGTVDPSAGY